MKCPYCGREITDSPQSALKGVIPEAIRQLVPMIVKCDECKSTFSVKTLNERWAIQSALAAA